MNNYFKILLIIFFSILSSSCISPALFDDPVSSDEPIAIGKKPQTQQREKRKIDKAQPPVERIPQTESYKVQLPVERIPQAELTQPPVERIPQAESAQLPVERIPQTESVQPPIEYIPQTESVQPPVVERIPQKPPQSLEEITPLKISDYRLNAGDLISIKVFGEEDFSVTTHLNETGTISYPFLGELKLSDLTISRVERLITSGLGKDYLVNPKVTVTILEYQKIFVNGEVKNPGGYAFAPGLNVNKAISLAGGFTEKSSRDEIFIIRSGKKTGTPQPANLKTYMKPGDVVIVKEYQQFFVNGEVRNPGGYAFVLGLTVNKAISLAGGFTEKSSRDEISIIRARDKNKAAIPQLANLKTYIKPGDIIIVKEYQKFFVNGEVEKPGRYTFEPGMTVEKAISIAGGFTQFGSAKWSKIVVLRGGDETVEAQPANLRTPIHPGDIVTIHESAF